MIRFGALAGLPSRCRFLLVLMLCLTTAACAAETAPGPITNAALGPVTRLKVSTTSVGDSWLSLSWTNPTDTHVTGVLIRRLEGAKAPTLTSGTLVRDFTDQADYVVDPGLTPGTQYSYAFFVHDGANRYAAASTTTGWTTGARRTSSSPSQSPR